MAAFYNLHENCKIAEIFLGERGKVGYTSFVSLVLKEVEMLLPGLRLHFYFIYPIFYGYRYYQEAA